MNHQLLNHDGNEKDDEQWKIWMTRKFSTASSACSFHGTARTVATSNDATSITTLTWY